jgi:tetratricopeptide (TPR) repeat protein
MRTRNSAAGLALAALFCTSAVHVGVRAQVPDKPEMPMAAGYKLGEIVFPNSGNAAAQAPFLRGVKLLHNFEYGPAIASFQDAQKADPGFALAYWGEAMAYNHGLWAEQDAGKARAVLSKLGATPQARSSKAGTEREKMYLAAVEALYGPGTKFERDGLYADKMDALAKAFPDDVEAQTFDALATLGRSHGTRDEANYLKAAAILEKLFPTHQNHPGVVHYMIHSYDDPAHAQLGLKAARLYDKIAPESPHAQHMTSHIFLALGMWPETVAANRRAIALANSMMASHRMTMDCGHGAGWLVYAQLQEGQDPVDDIEHCGKAALDPAALAKDRTVIGGEEDDASSYADMLVRRGVETGHWAAAISLPAGHFEYARYTLAYGRMLAARHDAAAVMAALAEMQTSRNAIAAALPRELPDEAQLVPWLDRGLAQGEAMVALASGDRAAGLAKLRAAAEAEQALPVVFGPPLVQKLGWELLGDELLADGKKTAAAAAYRHALEMAPGGRIATMGLKAATAS